MGCGLTGHPGMPVVTYHGKCSCLGDRNHIVLDCFLLLFCFSKCAKVSPTRVNPSVQQHMREYRLQLHFYGFVAVRLFVVPLVNKLFN